MTAPRRVDLDENGDTKLEAKLRVILNVYGIGGWVREYRFSKVVGRKHRFDYCWEKERVAAECDGGTYKAGGGRHNTDADREKLNLAAALGYRVLRFSGSMLDRPEECADVIRMALGMEGNDDRPSE